MGKGTDKLYITHSEWSSSDAFSASPFKNPVCTPDGTIFDVEVIGAWLEKHPGQNPVDGEPLSKKDLIRLNFSRNAGTDSLGAGLSDGKGDLVDPVTYKVFTDNTHIVAIRHGSYANVFAWETVERMNIKAKLWQDLVDDEPFTRADIITLQDPLNASARNLDQFKFLKDGHQAQLTSEQEQARQEGDINASALGSMGDKVVKAKAAVERARKAREAGADDKKLATNAAAYTSGKAAASFTSTGLTPETSGERAILTEEEYMLKQKRVKTKGYARMETNKGDLTIELHPEFAPKAVWNFIKLAQKGYYKDVAFHRNIPKFMIQGGDPSGTGRGGSSIWGKYFDDEFDGPLTHNARGTVSMANKGKNTNSSQFFITYKATPHLDRKHTIFGRIVDGDGVLAKMEAAPIDSSNRPLNDIVIHDIAVFVDPFEEFQKQKRKTELEEKEKEEIRKQGGTEDDKTTWTGKRIRQDGTIDDTGSSQTVGKYLKTSSGREETLDDGADNGAWGGEPSKKKIKTGGFGNFDSW
ncbi:unnamed protein product [Clonostachys rosea f. rosea IK726]|uniref:Peptidyl-prolyl cis-trans isomerase-like 2 n=2 Tax=Bionectria ochroleuca TaxID=29856 RepID=A0A0B7JX53_BIOOC|nr:unnamed protein product [Clonostachys rosea f. rosea IK726]